jgi:hypothetical protein
LRRRHCDGVLNFPFPFSFSRDKDEMPRYKEIEPEMPDNGGDTLGSRLTGSPGFFLAVSFF